MSIGYCDLFHTVKSIVCIIYFCSSDIELFSVEGVCAGGIEQVCWTEYFNKSQEEPHLNAVPLVI